VRWLADECVDAGLVGRLREAGHDVIYMAEIAPATSDAEVIRRAQSIARFGDTLFGRYTIIEEARFRLRPLRWMST
jgi:hypothetical protein